MTTIYLVRHGQASFGHHNYDQLSSVGEHQAELLGRWLNPIKKGITHFGSGTLQRQKQTLAQIMAGMSQHNRASDFTLSGLDELAMDNILKVFNPQFSSQQTVAAHLQGEANPASAFFKVLESALVHWVNSEQSHLYQESWHEFKNRTLAAVLGVAEQLKKGDEAILVTSGGVIATVLIQVLAIKEPDFFRLSRQIYNSSMTTLKFYKGHLDLHSFNGYAHLEETGDHRLMTQI